MLKTSSFKLFVVVVITILTLILFGLMNQKKLPNNSVVKQFPTRSFLMLDQRDPQQADWSAHPYHIVNVWASWCGICIEEHPFINQLSSEGIPVVGLNYRDSKQQARRYLSQRGDPYIWTIFDPKGDFSIDLGVLGTPESYLVDSKGKIVLKHTGRLTRKVWLSHFKPYFNSDKS
ncbi:DsbE family thiol:disulfide interchange protein [Vibrio sonorensis]|uniref:DsbE family thiol:disulfide interchange protein n=1 Tax=Vibrio sonorensis TaxID=1004316 RepID=UPI001FE1D1CD|nr:DsbE family thiol:disulfide interchange protein [Vibrio sonorensis]